MRRVLVLRPEPGASETVARARARGLDAVAIPLFAIEPMAWEVPDVARFDAVLFTSANAVRSAGDQLRALAALPAYAVGETTAAAAREAGFEVVATGDSGVDRLLQTIDPGLALLHLCGLDRREPAEAPHKMTPLVVYRAKPVEPPELPASGVVLIHSPRAARRLAELVNERSGIAIAAISPAAAAAAGGGWAAVEVADRPNDDALLAVAERLCNNRPQ